jgi:hypothetical protein
MAKVLFKSGVEIVLHVMNDAADRAWRHLFFVSIPTMRLALDTAEDSWKPSSPD